jgi:hypothetical protein
MSGATAGPNAHGADPREAAVLDRVAAEQEPAPSGAAAPADAPIAPPRFTMDWLDDEDETPDAAGPEPAEGTAGEAPPNPADEPAQARRGRAWLVAGAVLAVLAGGAYLALRPAPEPVSAALDAEHESAAPIGADEPLSQVDPGAAETRAERPPQADPVPVPDSTEDPLQPVEPLPQSLAETPASPPEAPPAAVSADGERLVHLVRQLETHRALIERLERAEKLLRDRVDGLELVIQARDESGRVRPAATAPEVITADELGTSDEPAAAEPRRRPPAPKPSRAVRKVTHSLPPSTTSRPVKTLQPRAPSPLDRARLPFSVESVDTWNGEKTVVVRSQGRLIDLRPGDSHQGWRIESAHGQTVTVRTPDGGKHTIEAGSEP